MAFLLIVAALYLETLPIFYIEIQMSWGQNRDWIYIGAEHHLNICNNWIYMFLILTFIPTFLFNFIFAIIEFTVHHV